MLVGAWESITRKTWHLKGCLQHKKQQGRGRALAEARNHRRATRGVSPEARRGVAVFNVRGAEPAPLPTPANAHTESVGSARLQVLYGPSVGTKGAGNKRDGVVAGWGWGGGGGGEGGGGSEDLSTLPRGCGKPNLRQHCPPGYR